MAERNTENLDAKNPNAGASGVDSASANGAGAGVDNTSASNANSVRERIAANERARDALREKIDKIVDGQDDPVVYPVDLPEEGADEKLVTGPVIATAPKPRREKTQAQNIFAKMLNACAKNLKTLKAKFKTAKKRTKILIIAIPTATLLALIIIPIAINANSNTPTGTCSNSNAVTLNYHPDGYDENPNNAVIVAVFISSINEKLASNNGYTYENAIHDYQAAYDEANEDLKLDIMYAYASFVFRETGDADAARTLLEQIETDAINAGDAVGYYTILYNIYTTVGNDEMANHYQEILREVAPPEPIPDETIQQLSEGENE